MPDDFDPYHVWLGIPPDEQPANRYRLLGIRAFESNPDVIDNAADRQTVHLRTFQGGKHGLLTQRLLNEVAAARICLLNPQSKAAYDQQLRAALAASTPQSPVPSPFGAAPAPAAGGSQIRRSQAANIPVAKAIEPAAPQAAPQPEGNWEELIGTHETGPRKPSKKSRQLAARHQARQRLVYASVGGVLLVVAGIAALLYALNANADAALTFDWPAGDRAGATLAVDGERVPIPASGSWEFHCPPGEHRIVAQRPAFKFDEQVSVSAGDRHPVAPGWKPKAVLLLNWPLAERIGAALTVDGRPAAISQRETLELPVEPGTHVISVRRPGAPPIETTVSVASDQRQSVSLGARRATFVIDWPAADRGGAKLMIDNREQRLDAPKLEFNLVPGRHTVRIVREGFEPINKTVEIGATGLSPFTPHWIWKDASAATGGAPITEPAPSTDVPEPPGAAADNVAKKKLPVPSDAEQKRIAKQLDEAYKTDPLPEKERALAEQLFALADQPGTSPDERYMVLMKAVGLAAKLWDLNSALHGIDLLDAGYEIDSFEIKQKVIDDAVRLAASPEHAAAAMTAAEQVIEQAVAEERYDNALAMADAANKALNKLPAESRAKKDASDRLARRRREIVVLQTASAAAVEAEAALEKDPANPEANSSLGRWYCLYKGDWDLGLPFLAKGKDGTTKSLAQQELAVNLELKPQLDLADGWWDVAQKEVGLPRDLARLHAGEIYQLMLPNLQAGVKKTAVEKRLTEIQPIVEQRLSQNAARRGAWDQFDLTHAKLEDGFVRLSKDENVIVTKDGYSGPLDISLIARTAGSNIRIYGPRGSSVIFNWEMNPNELRVTRPDGNDSPESGSLATATVQPLAPNRWYPLRWRIAADGMEIWIAGKAVFAEKKSYDLSAKARVAVRAIDSNVDIKSLSVALVKKDAGTKSALETQSGAPVPFLRGHWVDVLRLVDTTKNVVKGNWSRNGTDVSCEPEGGARIRVPVVANGSYDLEVEFTRTDGDGDVNTIFTANGQQCLALLSMDHGRASGLEYVDGKGPLDDGNPTTVRPGTLVNGHRYRLLINVRLPKPDHASIDVSLDGKPYLPHWEGNPASLSLEPRWRLPDLRELGLATWDSRVTFHSMRLRVVAGRAIAETAAPEMGRPLTSASTPSGAVLMFTFDKNSFFQRDGERYVRDLSGNGNHGLVKGTKPVEGRVGDALSFNGRDDRVECTDSQSLNPADAITICAWVKARINRPAASIISKDDWKNAGRGRGYVLRGDGNLKPNFTISHGANSGDDGWRGATSDTQMELEKWHHVAGRYDGKTVDVFVDGVRVGTSKVSGPVAHSPYKLVIGRGTFATDRYFDGAIDEVAVFARALTEEEIQRIYQMGVQGKSLSAMAAGR